MKTHYKYDINRRVYENEIRKSKKKKWISFDQFKDLQFGIWKVTLPNNASEWKNGFCNCPNFFKEYICKPPPAAKDIALGEKRKRGRPRKITKAHLID